MTQSIGDYKSRADVASAGLNSERLVDLCFSKNADNILHAMTNAGNIYTWNFEGDLDAKDVVPKCKQVSSLNIGLKQNIMMTPHDHVKSLLYAVSDSNMFSSCDLSSSKVIETRKVSELNKICTMKVAKDGIMSGVFLGDNSGKVALIDGRAGKSEKAAALFETGLRAPQVVDMGKYIGVYGKEMTDHAVKLFDIKNPTSTIQSSQIFTMKMASLIPYFDSDTGVCISAANNTKKFNVHVLTEDGRLKELAEVELKEEIQGYAIFPKVVVDVMKVELLRLAIIDKQDTVGITSIMIPKKNVSCVLLYIGTIIIHQIERTLLRRHIRSNRSLS